MAFSSEWLAMREPADHAARNAALLAQTVARTGRNAVVVDLGSGTGSTARAFSHPVCNTWTWRFIDSDRSLLDIARERHPRSVQFEMNLNNIEQFPLEHADLVTASALLDLMPEEWVHRLAVQLKDASIPFYAAINYNGEMHWTPANNDDEAITADFNLHQQTDKGIGPALGPMSGTQSARIFSEHGFKVSLADSPWELSGDQAVMQCALFEGIANAADEIGNSKTKNWVTKRCANAANTTGYIGHTDLFAVPVIT